MQFGVRENPGRYDNLDNDNDNDNDNDSKAEALDSGPGAAGTMIKAAATTLLER